MGVIYKLKPEIKDFILEQKKVFPIISCRKLSSLVQEKFQIKVSKSSINSLFKEADLSMPVGRRSKKKRICKEAVSGSQEEIKLLASPTTTLEQNPIEAVKPPTEPEKPVEVKQPVQIEPLVEIAKPEQIEEPVAVKETILAQDRECSGAILLKAADCLTSCSYYICEAIKNRLNLENNDILARIEALIFKPLFEPDNISGLWKLIGRELSVDTLNSYLTELQSVKSISLDVMRVISTAFQEVRCIKVSLSDGSVFYLDGQLHTVWSATYIPFDFIATIYNIKSYVNNYFFENSPFILFMAPGYDAPIKEFFNFTAGLDAKEKKVTRLTLYGNKFDELDTIHFERPGKHNYIFGLWPWQFVEYRKVISIGQFNPIHLEALNKDFYTASIEMEISQPDVQQSVTLKGYALKTNPSEKTRLVILHNPDYAETDPAKIIGNYLNRWPNFEEAFQDLSRKIEVFTYTAGTYKPILSTEELNLEGAAASLKTLFNKYLLSLDLYVKRFFLPPEYQDKDFPTIKERFYNLSVSIKQQNNTSFVTFKLPPGYQFLKDLEYACRRLNEREISFAPGKKTQFQV